MEIAVIAGERSTPRKSFAPEGGKQVCPWVALSSIIGLSSHFAFSAEIMRGSIIALRRVTLPWPISIRVIAIPCRDSISQIKSGFGPLRTTPVPEVRRPSGL
jgi:hypothetical protein